MCLRRSQESNPVEKSAKCSQAASLLQIKEFRQMKLLHQGLKQPAKPRSEALETFTAKTEPASLVADNMMQTKFLHNLNNLNFKFDLVIVVD